MPRRGWGATSFTTASIASSWMPHWISIRLSPSKPSCTACGAIGGIAAMSKKPAATGSKPSDFRKSAVRTG